MSKKTQRNWMTVTGSILTAIAGAIQAAVQLCPAPEWVPWLNFVSALAAGGGVPLIGMGIRRRLPAKTKPKTE